MDSDFLKHYLDEEIRKCRRILSDEVQPEDVIRTKLRKLYGAPLDRSVVYCESGGLKTIHDFPPETLLVMPVFPYDTPEKLTENIGDFPEFLSLCTESKRIYPVVQDPRTYAGKPHLEQLFNLCQAPSYFVRGAFAYSVLLGFDAELVPSTGGGVPVLTQIAELMDHCEVAHSDWLRYALENTDCWESRYRSMRQIADTAFRNRVRESLKYRFASVALCIGKLPADEILKVFDPVAASRLLLHLHIIFDHVICHGFGSNFCVSPDAHSGTDLIVARSEIFQPIERTICSALKVPFPKVMNTEFAALCNEEHFLRGIELDSLQPEGIEEIREKIYQQVNVFRKQVESLEKKERLISRSISLSAILLGAWLGGGALASVVGLLAAGGLNQSINIPDVLSKEIIERARQIYAQNLGCYLIGNWESDSLDAQLPRLRSVE